MSDHLQLCGRDGHGDVPVVACLPLQVPRPVHQHKLEVVPACVEVVRACARQGVSKDRVGVGGCATRCDAGTLEASLGRRVREHSHASRQGQLHAPAVPLVPLQVGPLGVVPAAEHVC